LSDERDDRDDASQIAAGGEQQSVTVPWSPPVARRRKGILHRPASRDLDPRDREALLTAIAKARSWMDDLIDGRAHSFEEIAEREQKVARHIRFLAPLAFLSPRIIDAIANGDVPAGATVSGLVRSLPHSWANRIRTAACTLAACTLYASILATENSEEMVWKVDWTCAA
jgi:hypothetical protein